MNFFVGLVLGILLGAWFVGYCMNRYYQSDVWQAYKRVLLEEVKVQETAEMLKRTRNETEIDKLLDGRMGRE